MCKGENVYMHSQMCAQKEPVVGSRCPRIHSFSNQQALKRKAMHIVMNLVRRLVSVTQSDKGRQIFGALLAKCLSEIINHKESILL